MLNEMLHSRKIRILHSKQKYVIGKKLLFISKVSVEIAHGYKPCSRKYVASHLRCPSSCPAQKYYTNKLSLPDLSVSMRLAQNFFCVETTQFRIFGTLFLIVLRKGTINEAWVA